jgi:hypothetical protein
MLEEGKAKTREAPFSGWHGSLAGGRFPAGTAEIQVSQPGAGRYVASGPVVTDGADM